MFVFFLRFVGCFMLLRLTDVERFEMCFCQQKSEGAMFAIVKFVDILSSLVLL